MGIDPRGMDYHWSPRRGSADQQKAAMLRVPQRQASIQVTLFDIEKDGDPRISWYMYYDFVVTKSEAYYQLQPGYLPTENYPRRQKSEPVTIKGERRYPCRVPHCSADPFTRHHDLERHFRQEHENSGDEPCDYSGCGDGSHEAARSGPGGPGKNTGTGKKGATAVFRLDKIQDHYRDQHNEDLIPPGDDHDPAKVDHFLAQTVGAGLVSLSWWRCSRCKQRVIVRIDDYQCLRCKLLCEPERVAWRRSMLAYEEQARIESMMGGVHEGGVVGDAEGEIDEQMYYGAGGGDLY